MVRLGAEMGTGETITKPIKSSFFKWDRVYLDTINYICKGDYNSRLGGGDSGAPVFIKSTSNNGIVNFVFGGCVTGGVVDNNIATVYIVKPSIIKSMFHHIATIN